MQDKDRFETINEIILDDHLCIIDGEDFRTLSGWLNAMVSIYFHFFIKYSLEKISLPCLKKKF